MKITNFGNDDASKNGDDNQRNYLKMSYIHTVFYFYFFGHISFFGTGNVASISSFNLSAVYRFFDDFRPFVMTGLLITKIAIPFFLLSVALGAVTKISLKIK